MAIDLKNVNISLNEFQRISSGWYNAGEVKLKNANTLDKVNNHVATWWYDNKDDISHAETVAIKEALVKALSQHGVEGEALNRARQKLGLQPMDPSDKSLLKRSVMPLTRQQIREILDENAETLNQSEGHERIRTQAELDARKGDRALEKSTAKRDAVNAALADKNRTLDVNWEISRFEKVVSDYVDYNTPEERAKLLAVAEKQLDQLMQTCHCRPREDHAATATLELAGGQVISMPTGMSEKAFAERLENIIVRFKGRLAGPDEVERGLLKDFRALGSTQDKQVFLAELPNGPQYGLKARSLAVQCLYSRRVADYATLSLANRLGANDALSLATAILNMPKDATPDQIRANAVLTALAAKAPVAVPDNEKAYVPATSNTQYNNFVRETLSNKTDLLLPAHRRLAETTRQALRSRLGATAMPDALPLALMARVNAKWCGLIPDAREMETTRLSADAIAEQFLTGALKGGANRILDDEFRKAIRARDGDTYLVQNAVNALNARHPDFLRRMTEAQAPADAARIVDEHRQTIELLAGLYCKAS
ncbi:MAG: hypothetical protein J6W80_04255, partial [Kiritimatiellae bacterium]|nr:hypothetical protein [Kiritimatiellia bacterium]